MRGLGDHTRQCDFLRLLMTTAAGQLQDSDMEGGTWDM